MQTSLTERDTQPVGRRPRPVFVDPSGRRRRVVRRVAIGLSALVACYAVVLLAAAMGAPIPRSGFLPLPDVPTQQQPAPATGAPQAGDRSPTGATSAGGATVTGGPKVSAPAGPPASPPSTSGVAVTPSVSATTPQRPNSNANPAPPGLTKHTDSHTHPNGPTR